ncbi:P-loop containing nucleoside triphosphate hydrolases superfamily protein [Actinidia rufa]|uniref:P-loop containing nucleoside triphosphate hydrolases superfamily protein n=1 Tax=Actinidia rufa TaxID=165716 RepID=A0A7J0FFN9_9ERIC|nr:P-loop containing nucleoside triphosphate hydrolases superfamily protein [Actinidia rufa]
MAGTSLAALQDHLKLARDYALEGVYDTSIIFFDGAIAQITKHLNTLDDPLNRAKWMNAKKALIEEIVVVKQLDAERRDFKEIPVGGRPTSPPISSKSSFFFQPLDEYPTSSGGRMDDPDVWRPPSRDNASRRPTRAGHVGMRKLPKDGTWAHGSTSWNDWLWSKGCSNALFSVEMKNGDTGNGKSKCEQYEGPDADLAAMLERDVLDSTRE